jgi:class 3 adenylate cyclase
MAANDTRSKFIKAGANGNRALVRVAQDYAEGLTRFREYLYAEWVERLKPLAEQSDASVRAALQAVPLDEFDMGSGHFVSALSGITLDHGIQQVLVKAAQRECATLEGALSLDLAIPDHSKVWTASASGHRLSAVMSADIVGYTALVEANERNTLAERNRRFDRIAQAVNAHGGRIFKTMGDGLMVEFRSAFDAVNAALEIQKAMAARNAEDGVLSMRLRIGINACDVQVEGDDLLGDGVNVASRVEKEAEPGGICITASVRDDVGNNLGVDFDDLGHYQLRNRVRPVHLFNVLLPSAKPSAAREGTRLYSSGHGLTFTVRALPSGAFPGIEYTEGTNGDWRVGFWGRLPDSERTLPPRALAYRLVDGEVRSEPIFIGQIPH